MAEVEDNKLRIRQKAHDMFMQYGIRSVSMDDMAKELGSSKKTLYQYYKDKNAIVEDVVNTMLIKNRQECEADKKYADNAIHEGFMAITKTTELFSRMNPVLMYDLHKYHSKAYKKFLDYKTDFLYKTFRTSLEWGVADGLYRDDINIEVLSRFRVESIIIPFMPDFYTKVKTSLAEVHEQLFLHFLYGMATPEGFKKINKYRKIKPKDSSK